MPDPRPEPQPISQHDLARKAETQRVKVVVLGDAKNTRRRCEAPLFAGELGAAKGVDSLLIIIVADEGPQFGVRRSKKIIANVDRGVVDMAGQTRQRVGIDIDPREIFVVQMPLIEAASAEISFDE